MTNASGSNSTLRSNYITVNAPPVVSSIDPSSGRLGSALIIMISGSPFICRPSPRTTFTYSGTSGGKTASRAFVAIRTIFVSPTELTCYVKVPVTAVTGRYNVTVMNGDGQAVIFPNAFTITSAKPVVSSINPDHGVAGNTVTITNLAGKNFSQNAKVFLKRYISNSLVARNVKVVSSQKITCLFSLSAKTAKGKWDVVVKNQDGKTGVKSGVFIVR
ncbi:MAG: IPT/TIG domain-containing protein [Methanomicrobiales archaeon]|nr:IPT/TIG domain-containing protein [Methanomicrobiales archaeon]